MWCIYLAWSIFESKFEIYFPKWKVLPSSVKPCQQKHEGFFYLHTSWNKCRSVLAHSFYWFQLIVCQGYQEIETSVLGSSAKDCSTLKMCVVSISFKAFLCLFFQHLISFRELIWYENWEFLTEWQNFTSQFSYTSSPHGCQA